MALEFTGGSSDIVTVSSASDIDDKTTFTWAMWLYLNTAQNDGVYVRKRATFLVAEFGVDDSAHFNMIRDTTNAEAISGTGFWETGKWLFVAVTYDSTDGPRLWKGDLDTLVTEIGSYDTRDAGSGTFQTDNTFDLGIGNRVGSSLSIDGRIASFLWTNYRANEADLRKIQFQFQKTYSNDVIHFELGYEGTGTQPDYTGNGNSGAVTGTTVAAHVPISPFSLAPRSAVHYISDFTTAVVSEGTGTDDENVPIDVDTHDDVNTDHSDLWRNTASPATSGSNIQNDITPTQGSTITDNDANSTTGPSPDTTYWYILRDWEDAGESASHDSNEISILTAPARPTSLTLVEARIADITISWTDQTADTYKHRVYYRLKGNTTWILATPTGVAAGTDQYKVENLAPGVYEFHVRAWNDGAGLESGFDQILESATATELRAFQCDTFQYDAFQVREASYVYPSADVAIGNWKDEVSGTTDIYTSIDEEPVVDADYVTTLVTAADDIYRYRLEPIGDRPCDQGFVLQYRIEKEGAGTVRMIFDIIKEDLTVVATQTHASVPDAITDYEIALTAAQVATLKAANWFVSPLVQVTADNGT
jgi:hypothetical protein